MIVEIVNPQGNVSYTRPHDHPDVMEALKTPGYSVRGSEAAIADSLQRMVGEPDAKLSKSEAQLAIACLEHVLRGNARTIPNAITHLENAIKALRPAISNDPSSATRK